MPVAVQCDFDGTVTREEVGFILLDFFAGGNWRSVLEEYMEGRIPVGVFNKRVFAMIKEDRQTLTDFILKSGRVRVRPGLSELVPYCHRKGLEFIIVSNGLLFYIEAILREAGINGVEVFASQNQFSVEGMKVEYIGPDGREMTDGFKEAHTIRLLEKGYRVVYVGNGISDIYPARRATHVFATGELLRRCREEKLACLPFDDFHDIIRGLEALPLG
jgi:2-hydroxy-3-keto-5-methylthiopentenyl-1-phosphate phosphatase